MPNISTERPGQAQLPASNHVNRTGPLVITGERQPLVQKTELKIQATPSKPASRDTSPYRVPYRQNFKAPQRSVQESFTKPVRPSSLPKPQERAITPLRTAKKYTVVDLSSIQTPMQKPLGDESANDVKRNIFPPVKPSQPRLSQRTNNIFAIRKIGNFTFREIISKEIISQTSSGSNNTPRLVTTECESPQTSTTTDQTMTSSLMDWNTERTPESRKSFQFDQEVHLRSILKKSHDSSSKSRDSERRSSSVKSVHFSFC